ncbi:outer membrane protein assembly factor BamB family protein [Archangium lansingense]|uniref:PQQ-binding-like beta-propeller repeat protein n=1 Tax=Archangium lansingense TaxID=2995310 RepID=A0ABT4A6R0_9BACT|nr:PQQ-binding-like beta-propeller repeat protein [Archangium lansinium]MCY1077354.1 PQQ-binding-like beta-propeller repeat protein [Archangium lansinium]
MKLPRRRRMRRTAILAALGACLTVSAPLAQADSTSHRVFEPRTEAIALDHSVTFAGAVLDTPPAHLAQVFPERYSDIPGVFTFRGGPTRTGGSWGICPLRERKLEIAWIATTGRSPPPWGGGAGWTGQPAIVQWPAVIRHSMSRLGPRRFEDGFVEVIQGSLDGSVYFLDLHTGRPTRRPLATGNPIKGSVSLDPRGYPLLFVGQGIPDNKPIGLRVYNLISHQQVFFLPGRDAASPRKGWGAFDSSGLLNRATDSYVVGGENGLFYVLRLNTDFDSIDLTLKVRPEVLRYRYAPPGRKHLGIENSFSVVGNLALFADNGGTLQALDLRTFKPVWAFAAGDDTDASLAVELEGERPVLYTGTEVDKTGPRGNAWLRKLDALTGKVLWERAYPCQGARTPKKIDAGAFATPLVGTGDVSHLVVYTLSRCPNFTGGLMVALDKASGAEVWRRPMSHFAWSSPTACRDEQGHTFILQGDISGEVSLLDARTGDALDSVKLKGGIEASPAVFDGMAVLATRGEWIYGLRLR